MGSGDGFILFRENLCGMPTHTTQGSNTFERLLRRYETTETKCPECGFVDTEGNWTSHMRGDRIVYAHECPSCGSERDHSFHPTR